MTVGIARCGWGKLGLVLRKGIATYPDGSSSEAYLGVYLLKPLKRWSSRKPRWIVRIGGDA